MEFLGIGPLELFFVLIIALIVLGPTDMVKAGRALGRFLRTIVTSPTWRAVQQTSRELRYLPNKLMREAGIDELKNTLPDVESVRKEIGMDELKADLKKDMTSWQEGISDWTRPAPTIGTPEKLPEVPTANPGELPQIEEELPVEEESPVEESGSTFPKPESSQESQQD
jgi:Sec-independent protein translocase protein TatA